MAPKKTRSSSSAPARVGGIDDLRAVEPLDQEANAPVDLAQALLAVDVVAVLGAVAVAGGPRDRGDAARAARSPTQMVELRLQPREAAGRHVVLRARGQQRRALGDVVVVGCRPFRG